ARGRLAREVRALASRERGADRLRRRIHRQRERRAGVVDETGLSERDAAEVTEECAVACTELRRVLLGRAELRAHGVTIARARGNDRLERPMHGDPLGRAGELRIVRYLRDEYRSATWVAPERGELGPVHRQPHVDVLRQKSGATTSIAGAVESGVRRDQADGNHSVACELLRDLFEERCGRERVTRGVENFGGDLPDESDGA